MSYQPSDIHTYHCLCSTLLLATPYSLSDLPRRAAPSLDRAHILPLPPLSRPSNNTNSTADNENNNADVNAENPQDDHQKGTEGVLPSLLTQNVRPARKVMMVRRKDGFEKRRVLRCGRCGVGIGYEILGEEKGGEEGMGRVMYLLEGGLVETKDMGKDEGEG